MFGVGWGLAGVCPGPAIAAAGAGHWQSALFTLGMIDGMVAHEWMLTEPGRNQAVMA